MWFWFLHTFRLLADPLLASACLELHVLVDRRFLVVYGAIILVRIQIGIHAIELVKVRRFQRLNSGRDEKEREKSHKITLWDKADNKTEIVNCFSIIFHIRNFFIMPGLLFMAHMLYQLVNKTLETRLLFLLKPICSIIFMNLSISFPFAPDFFGVNENDSLFRPETGELFCSTKGGGSSISSHNLPAACCVMMRWWVKYAHRCWHFLFSVCGC